MNLKFTVDDHSSALGRWRHVLGFPSGADAELATVFWSVEGELSFTHEAILPKRDVVLIFNLGPSHALLDPHDPSRTTDYTAAWVSGLQQERLTIASHRRTHLVAVELRPAGAYAFFGLPMAELANHVVELDQVLGAEALAWREQLADAATARERLRRLAALVRERCTRGPAMSRTVAAALRQLSACDGAVRVAELCGRLGVSHKRLTARFREEVGLTPKTVARLARFRRTLAGLNGDGVHDLADLALACGYYDQAHFANDFRSFAGVSPTQFLLRRGPDGESLIAA